MEHRQNSGTPRNSGETTENPRKPAEHPGIPKEQQRNMSGTPQNNETIQNKEKLWFFLKKMLT